MYRKIVTLVAGCGLALLLGLPMAFAAAAPAATTDAGEAAAAYTNALALGNAGRAWNLLSEGSKQGLTKEEFEAGFNAPRAIQKPPASSVMRAIATGSEPADVAGVVVRGDTAFVQVKGMVQVTQTVMLVKEPGGWRVDLRPTDEANSRDAAELVLATIRAEAAQPASRGQRQEVSLPALRATLRPEAKNYKVLKADVTGDKAQVLLGADVPVSIVFQEVRSGAGWTVRTLAPVDILSPNPLEEAVRASQRQACEDQLRQIGAAIQMYAASSDDQLPDPSRWVDQIQPYLRRGTDLHCPSDPSDSGISYAMNKNLAGKRRQDIGNPSAVPMIFESTTHGRNVNNAGESWPASSWHEGGVLVLYADGTVRLTPQKPAFSVPAAPPGGAPRTPTVRPQARPGAPGPAGAPGGAVRRRPQPQPK